MMRNNAGNQRFLLYISSQYNIVIPLDGLLRRHVFCACFRLEMQELRERQKEEEVLALKRSMEGGMVSVFLEFSCSLCH